MNSSSIFTDFEEIVYPKESRSLDNKNINEFAGFTILENEESQKKDDLKSTIKNFSSSKSRKPFFIKK